MKTCAIIPAAGLGSRLNALTPKILLKLTETKTVWSVLKHNLMMVDHIHVIVSPQGERMIRATLMNDIISGFVSISVQLKPIGMGDAIFQASPVWSKAEQIVIVWGDQAFVSRETLIRSLSAHSGIKKTIALPLTTVLEPYVEYVFTHNLGLSNIKQVREGDVCSLKGLSDVGVFVLSVNELLPEWHSYLKGIQLGSHTQEINFLPFLPFLSKNGWQIHQIRVANPLEARGINTPDDLAFFQHLYEGMPE